MITLQQATVGARVEIPAALRKQVNEDGFTGQYLVIDYLAEGTDPQGAALNYPAPFKMAKSLTLTAFFDDLVLHE